jgi:hypothetical protein
LEDLDLPEEDSDDEDERRRVFEDVVDRRPDAGGESFFRAGCRSRRVPDDDGQRSGVAVSGDGERR